MSPIKVAPLILLTLIAALSAGDTASQPVAAPAQPPPPGLQNQLAETSDLRMVADSALQAARAIGPERVLVVFDIDNTLLAMEQDLGSDQWFYWQKDLAVDDPCSAMLVSDRIEVQGALFHASAMRLTQPDAAQQVRRLQDAGLRVIALTSRSPDFRLQTFRELRRNGISFWPSALPPQRGFPEPFVPTGGTRYSHYEDGVFLTAGQHKGDMLKALLEKTDNDQPAVIVLTDDKDYSLQQMMETFAGSGTRVHAWRYSREDDRVAEFDSGGAAGQWDQLRPALMEVEAILGPDNFQLPERTVPKGCP